MTNKKNDARLIRIVLIVLITFSLLLAMGSGSSPMTTSGRYALTIISLFILLAGIGLPILLGNRGIAASRTGARQKRRHTISTLFLGLFIFLFFGIIGMVFSLLPNGALPSLPGLIFIWGSSFLIGLSGAMNMLRPRWYYRMFGGISITNLILAEGLYGLGFGHSILFAGIIALVILVYILSWLMPIIHLGAASAITASLFAPKSKFTILAIMGLFALTPIARFFSVFGDRFFMIFYGLEFSLLGIAFSQIISTQIWADHIRAKLDSLAVDH